MKTLSNYLAINEAVKRNDDSDNIKGWYIMAIRDGYMDYNIIDKIYPCKEWYLTDYGRSIIEGERYTFQITDKEFTKDALDYFAYTEDLYDYVYSDYERYKLWCVPKESVENMIKTNNEAVKLMKDFLQQYQKQGKELSKLK